MRGRNVTAAAVLARALGCAGILLFLASLHNDVTVDGAARGAGATHERRNQRTGAGLSTNMQAGSEEDFILNVGRRTFFPPAPRRSTPSPGRRWTARSPG